ncbi:hypothetical protein SUDANB1_05657 [Streptomyces sp. enrichment culture]|uniref:ParB N-terminal domain-containing protein n=1 Tax=Streptomyces sp. enrichment culture TaxID=1795815 RepID=UPI003F549BFF
MTTTLPLNAITTGERDRQDVGDLTGLMESITAVGLLHPVVVTGAHHLVAGGRRLAAIRELGWAEVPVTVVDLATAADVLRGEADENTCRKPLTPYEAARARQRRAQVLAHDAKERQAHGQTAPGKTKGTNASPSVGEAKGGESRTAKVAAIGTGYSGSTLDKVDRIRDVAERGVIRQGRTELPAPAPLRDVAREALEEVKAAGAAVGPAHRRVEQALADYVDTDPEVRTARLAKQVSGYVVQVLDGLPKLDAGDVAAICDEDLLRGIQDARDSLDAWVSKIEAQRAQGLRLVGAQA